MRAGQRREEAITMELLEASGQPLTASWPTCPTCGKRLLAKDKRPRRVVMEAAEAVNLRGYGHCLHGRKGIFPLNERWNYGPDTLSFELSCWAQETCCPCHMLKLSKNLFCEEADSICADHYERVFFIHVPASQHPENGRIIYMLALQPGRWIMFGNQEVALGVLSRYRDQKPQQI